MVITDEELVDVHAYKLGLSSEVSTYIAGAKRVD